METIGKFFVAMIILFLSFLIDGFFLMKMWLWFIVPTFPVAELPYAKSIGLAIFIGVVIKTSKFDDKDKSFVDLVGEWFTKVLIAAVVFFISWLVYLCIQ